MRGPVLLALLATFNVLAHGQDKPSLPRHFVIGRHTFFDFGPPTDFYELFFVRLGENRTAVERITLTPAADACVQPAKVEVADAFVEDSIANLLGNTDPCRIPIKELSRESKRCKKCLVFSGANVAMQTQCQGQTRLIRADILDRDMFDPSPHTPEHTSWTMRLLARLDKAVGPGVMERPIFDIPEERTKALAARGSENLSDISAGKYDLLFKSAPDKLSDLYKAAQIPPPAPTVRLVSSTPFQPEGFTSPGYPPLARLAHVEGLVSFTVDINLDGSTTNFVLGDGHPMLRAAAEKAASTWKFSKDAAGQRVTAAIEFATNCQRKKP